MTNQNDTLSACQRAYDSQLPPEEDGIPCQFSALMRGEKVCIIKDNKPLAYDLEKIIWEMDLSSVVSLITQALQIDNGGVGAGVNPRDNAEKAKRKLSDALRLVQAHVEGVAQEAEECYTQVYAEGDL